MLPNIVLIGFMGCGKSSVGRRIAENTGHHFVDTDELVTAQAGRSITQIFKERGETHFRDLETAALHKLADDRAVGIVLATGGGIILREDNRATLRRIGPVVWLDVDPNILFERASRNRKRPLLQSDDPRGTFDALLAARCPIYEMAASVRVDSTGLSHDEVARVVIEETQRFAGAKSADGFGS